MRGRASTAVLLFVVGAGCGGGTRNLPAVPPCTREPGRAAPATVAETPGHDSDVLALAFSGDSQRLATGDRNGTVLVWDVATRRARRVVSTEDWIADLDWSPDGSLLAVASGTRVFLVTTAHETAPSVAARLEGHEGDIRAVRFDPSGEKLATAGGHDGTVRLWRVLRREVPRVIPMGHRAEVERVEWSPDGSRLAVVSVLGSTTMTVFREADLSVEGSFSEDTGAVEGVAFSPGGQQLVIWQFGLWLWNLRTQTSTRSEDVEQGGIADLGWLEGETPRMDRRGHFLHLFRGDRHARTLLVARRHRLSMAWSPSLMVVAGASHHAGQVDWWVRQP